MKLIQEVVLPKIAMLLAAISYIDAIDVFWKSVSGCIMVASFVLYYLAYRRKKKLIELQIQNEQKKNGTD